jgi:hypothetical protein
MKWEYLVEGLPLHQGQNIGIVRQSRHSDAVQEHLTGRGEEGWELVQFAGTAENRGCDIYAPGIIFIFKRLKI